MEREAAESSVRRIGTRGRFCFMDLPPEIRQEIYKLLLLSKDPLRIPSASQRESLLPDYKQNYPPVSILHTCSQINNEAIPIFYSNKLIISLPLTITKPLIPSPYHKKNFFLSNYRWTTLSSLSSLTFISPTPTSKALLPSGTVNPSDLLLPSQDPGDLFGHITTFSSEAFLNPPPPASFHTSGPEMLSRFKTSDLRYSPAGPDRLMVLTLENWISMKVARAEILGFQLDIKRVSALSGMAEDE